MIGWECPRCHRCYAPTVTECASCNAGVVTAPTPPVYVPVVVPQTLRPWPEWWPKVWCGDSTTGTLTWGGDATPARWQEDWV